VFVFSVLFVMTPVKAIVMSFVVVMVVVLNNLRGGGGSGFGFRVVARGRNCRAGDPPDATPDDGTLASTNRRTDCCSGGTADSSAQYGIEINLSRCQGCGYQQAGYENETSHSCHAQIASQSGLFQARTRDEPKSNR
jgi:hypothetical protein